MMKRFLAEDGSDSAHRAVNRIYEKERLGETEAQGVGQDDEGKETHTSGNSQSNDPCEKDAELAKG